MKILYAMIAGIFYLATIGSVSANDIAIKTARDIFTVKKIPERIIVMDVSAIDTLDMLGIKPIGIPVNLGVDYLNNLHKTAEKVGTLFDPDYEAIHVLQPDLVIVGGRSSQRYDEMKKIATTIDMTIWGQDLVKQAKQRLSAYGKLFSKQTLAEQIAAQFDEKILQAKRAVKGKGNALIILTNGPKITAYGIKGRFGWLHKVLNLPQAATNIAKAAHGEAITFEFIRQANPDWIIVIDRLSAISQKGSAAKVTLDNALVRETKAWKSNQLVFLNAANIYIAGGGIQAISKVMDEIILAFNGKK